MLSRRPLAILGTRFFSGRRHLPNSVDQELDARGLDCPMPLLKAKRALNAMRGGEQLRILATDKGSVRDFEVFARQSGNPLISSIEEDGVFIHVIEKKPAGADGE